MARGVKYGRLCVLLVCWMGGVCVERRDWKRGESNT